jgi:hypothetical protein
MIKPQRIVHDLKPGSLLKGTGAADQPQQPRQPSGDADYKALIRRLPCLSCGLEPSEAAHVRLASAAFGKASGLGKKPADKFCVPLCADDHRLALDAQHNRGELEFWNSLGIDPLAAAARLYAARGDFVRMNSVVHLIISERRLSRKT